MAEVPEQGRDGVRVARPRWRGAVLVCGKCLKRHDGGKALRRALKQEAGGARIIRASCFKLCPKRAVAVASAATLLAGEVLLLRDEADVIKAMPRLLPDADPR